MTNDSPKHRFWLLAAEVLMVLIILCLLVAIWLPALVGLRK